MTYIVMNLETAIDIAHGRYQRNCQLCPAKYDETRYVLPQSVLSDPDYSEVWEILSTLPQIEILEEP